MILIGGIAVCGAALGMFLGGLAAKLGKFEIKGNLIFCIVVNIVSIGFSFSLMAKCPSPPLAGVFDGYSNRYALTSMNPNYSMVDISQQLNQFAVQFDLRLQRRLPLQPTELRTNLQP